MKIEIRKVDEKRGIIQITTSDERWYIKQDEQLNNIFVPSVTWICEHYPKGIGFYKWLSQRSWDESEALKEAAGEKGSRVHRAIDDLICGKTILIDSKYAANDEEAKELTVAEYEAVMSFVEWCKDKKPKFLQHDFVVWGDGYAGTVDALCEIEDKKYIIDFKTSQSIWPSHELQLSAYKHAFDEVNLAILQLGYRLNKKKYKFTEIEDKFDLFLAAKQIWANETEGVIPLQKDYPMELRLE